MFNCINMILICQLFYERARSLYRTSQPLKSVLILQIGKDVFTEMVFKSIAIIASYCFVIVACIILYYIADRMKFEIKMDRSIS